MNKKRAKKAVSEILGTFILLSMAVALFSLINFMAIMYPFEDPIPSVNMVAKLDGGEIKIKHNYGAPLDKDTKIIVIIEDLRYDRLASDYLDAGDNNWNIGESIVIDPFELTGFDLNDEYVSIMVVDQKSNSVVMIAELQRGTT